VVKHDGGAKNSRGAIMMMEEMNGPPFATGDGDRKT
jgi:hypothetical protein